MTADLHLTQGVPATKQYRFVDAASVWPDADGCEAKAEVRTAPGGAVLLDLTPFLSTPAVVASGDGAGTDIVVVLTLTGQDTRTISANGTYDLFLSDEGDVDAQAIRVSGSVYVTKAVTDA